MAKTMAFNTLGVKWQPISHSRYAFSKPLMRLSPHRLFRLKLVAELSKPTCLEHLAKNPEYDNGGGVWMLIDIDTSKLGAESVTAVRSLLLRMQK
jgi:hypothetical protein